MLLKYRDDKPPSRLSHSVIIHGCLEACLNSRDNACSRDRPSGGDAEWLEDTANRWSGICLEIEKHALGRSLSTAYGMRVRGSYVEGMSDPLAASAQVASMGAKKPILAAMMST